MSYNAGQYVKIGSANRAFLWIGFVASTWSMGSSRTSPVVEDDDYSCRVCWCQIKVWLGVSHFPQRLTLGRLRCTAMMRRMRLFLDTYHQSVIQYSGPLSKTPQDIKSIKFKDIMQSFLDESAEVRVRNFRTLKTLRTRTQRVCLFMHLYSKEVNISQKNSEISFYSFLKSYCSLYKPHAQISTIVKTS
jgi:hypothetical protein